MLSLALVAALIVMLVVVHTLSAVAAAKTQAAGAADLAALAGADTARGLHTGDPCTVAEQVAARNSAALQDCVVGGEHPTEVHVEVSRPVDQAALIPQLTFPQLRAAAASRAGPPEALQE